MFSNKKTFSPIPGQEGLSLNHIALFSKGVALYSLGRICQFPSYVPVLSINSSPLKNFSFSDTGRLDEFFDHTGFIAPFGS